MEWFVVVLFNGTNFALSVQQQPQNKEAEAMDTDDDDKDGMETVSSLELLRGWLSVVGTVHQKPSCLRKTGTGLSSLKFGKSAPELTVYVPGVFVCDVLHYE